jgi:hypothetical protein
MDLIRQISFAIEASTTPIVSNELKIDGYESAQIICHCSLLREHKLILAGDCGTDVSANALLISRLTSAGHDFIDAARNDKIWSKTKALVANNDVPVPLDIFITNLNSVTLSALGLSSVYGDPPDRAENAVQMDDDLFRTDRNAEDRHLHRE